MYGEFEHPKLINHKPDNYNAYIFQGFYNYNNMGSRYVNNINDDYGRMATKLDTYLQHSYHSNERESRPKTKFFSLMIYAGYPMQ